MDRHDGLSGEGAKPWTGTGTVESRDPLPATQEAEPEAPNNGRTGPVLSRRFFLALTGAGTLGLFLRGPSGSQLVHAEPLAGGTLDPESIRQFVTPLLIPPVMPRAGTFHQRGGRSGDYYEISMKQFSQQILPKGLPPTTVWGYGAVTAGKRGLLLHNAPSLTIEAHWNRPVRVKWINDLKDANGNFRPHLLPVDPTLHWANPPGGEMGRDTRPAFTPGSYTGPVPIVTHVHGAVGVHDDSDGYAEAWYLPEAADIPDEYATQGTWYDFFARKAAGNYGVEWEPGSATFQYPNNQRASTIWYHDHTLGLTRLNVYAGPAGFFLIRGGPSGDDAVLDSRTGDRAILPGPAPKEGDKFPANKDYHEIPIAIQDRTFNADGSLFYPDSRAFFDGYQGPYMPDTDVSPIWNPEFFGNTMIVNGNTWPYLSVEQRRYRFRFLNGCDSRFLILDFRDIPGVEVWQIGNEGGFLAQPVNLTADHDNTLLMALAERADVIVDFTHVRRGRYVLGNVGPDEPFGGGEPDEDFEGADLQTTARVMQFRVGPRRGRDRSTPPAFLQLPVVVPLPAETTTRPLALLEMMSMYWDGPASAHLGTVDGDGWGKQQMWSDPVSETPAVGDVEVWEFFNGTADAHPMHIHEVVFEVVNRQDLIADEEGVAIPPFRLEGDVVAPEPWESGFKDTVIAYPGQVTRVRMRFTNPGQFTWHCHIVSHEDNEMMRPYRIGPEQVGQPMPHPHQM